MIKNEWRLFKIGCCHKEPFNDGLGNRLKRYYCQLKPPRPRVLDICEKKGCPLFEIKQEERTVSEVGNMRGNNMKNLIDQIESELGRPENFAIIIVKVPTKETTMQVFIGNPANFGNA